MIRGHQAITKFTKYGMLTSHYEAFFQAAKKNVVIGVRPVSKFARGLLEWGCPTKNFHLKAKSSQLGIAAGCIVCDPRLSHLNRSKHDAHKENIKKAFEKDNNLKIIDLVLPKERLYELNLLFNTETPNTFKLQRKINIADEEFTVSWKNAEKEQITVTAKKIPGTNNFGILDENNQPVKVVGSIITDTHKNQIIKPITADYDLLVIAPKMRDFEPGGVDQTLVRIPSVGNKNKAKTCSDTQIDSKQPAEDPNRGNVTPRIIEIIELLNDEIQKIDDASDNPNRKNMKGIQAIHHNAEATNPFANDLEEGNLPCAFFFPEEIDLSSMEKTNEEETKDLGRDKKTNMVLIQTLEEYRKLRSILHKVYCYRFPTNPALDNHRISTFEVAKNALERSLFSPRNSSHQKVTQSATQASSTSTLPSQSNSPR